MVFKMIRHVIIKTCPMRLNENSTLTQLRYSQKKQHKLKEIFRKHFWLIIFPDVMVTEYRDLQNLNRK